MLNKHIQRYYVLHDPVIADDEYDRLYQELRALEAQHPHLTTRDSPTQRAGNDLSQEFSKARHERPILSLANAFGDEDLQAWEARNQKLAPEATFRYIVEPKFDGLTIVLRYEDGLLVRAATRGDGEIGDVVTANARTVRSIPLRIPVAGHEVAPRVFVVRGEVLLFKDAFEALNTSRVQADLPIYINARNTASGSLKQKDARKTAERDLTTYAYDVVFADGVVFTSRGRQINYLSRMGFLTPPDVVTCDQLDEVVERVGWWADRRHRLRFEIDGVVIKLDDLAVDRRLGVVGKDPRGSIAYKFPSSEATTTLLQVEAQVGRSGRITPTAHLEPVFVGGVTVSNATLHNYSHIAALDLRAGDTVVLKRSGDVIPYIIGPVKGKRTGAERPVAPPTECPSSGDTLVRPSGMVDIYCPNPRCPERIFRSVTFFASRGGMNIEGLGPATLRLLIKEGIIADEADLFSLDGEVLAALEGFGEKKASALITSLSDAKDRSLDQLLTSLGIPGVGGAVAGLLTQAFSDLDALRVMAEDVSDIEASLAALIARLEGASLDIALRAAHAKDQWGSIQRRLQPEYEACAPEAQAQLRLLFERLNEQVAPLHVIEGVGPALVRQITDWFSDARNAAVLHKLRAAGLQLRQRAQEPSGGGFSGRTFVVTGALKSLTRDGAKAYIRERGGSVTGSVSRKTDYLLAGEKAGSKMEKAKHLGVSIINEDELRDLAGDEQ